MESFRLEQIENNNVKDKENITICVKTLEPRENKHLKRGLGRK